MNIDFRAISNLRNAEIEDLNPLFPVIQMQQNSRIFTIRPFNYIAFLWSGIPMPGIPMPGVTSSGVTFPGVTFPEVTIFRFAAVGRPAIGFPTASISMTGTFTPRIALADFTMTMKALADFTMAMKALADFDKAMFINDRV